MYLIIKQYININILYIFINNQTLKKSNILKYMLFININNYIII